MRCASFQRRRRSHGGQCEWRGHAAGRLGSDGEERSHPRGDCERLVLLAGDGARLGHGGEQREGAMRCNATRVTRRRDDGPAGCGTDAKNVGGVGTENSSRWGLRREGTGVPVEQHQAQTETSTTLIDRKMNGRVSNVVRLRVKVQKQERKNGRCLFFLLFASSRCATASSRTNRSALGGSSMCCRRLVRRSCRR